MGLSFVPGSLQRTRDKGPRTREQRSRQIAAEAFAGAELGVGAEPGRRGAEADGGQRARDLLDRQVRVKRVDHRAIAVPVARLVHRASEDPAGERALPAGGRADDQADLPGFGQVGKLGPKALRKRIFHRQVEHPRDLPHAKAVADRAVELEFVNRHSDGDHPAFAAARNELLVKRALVALVRALDE